MTPKLVVAFACGSLSTRRTRQPALARYAQRLTAVVVLPTPPFWFAMAKICAFMPQNCPIDPTGFLSSQWLAASSEWGRHADTACAPLLFRTAIHTCSPTCWTAGLPGVICHVCQHLSVSWDACDASRLNAERRSHIGIARGIERLICCCKPQ